jgi:hypothetical protein
MSLRRLLQDAAFDDLAVQAMTTAYEDVLRALDLPASAVHVREMLAKKIIEGVRQGERDPERLREFTLKGVG